MAEFERRAEDDVEDYHIKFREDEEMEFFTELALHETERWIQTVTKQSFKYQDDTRKSLENGVLLCELLNGLRPGTIKRINKLPTPLAGLDNINVFLKACKNSFGLTDTHLFNPSDLEDLSERAIAESDQLKAEYDRRLRNVAITIYWLGHQVASQPHLYQGPQLDLTAFSALVNRKHHDLVLRGDWEAAGNAVTSHQRQTSGYGGGSNSSTSRHTRDSSLDGYDKAESVNSLDENSFEMPMNRYNSASALYNTNSSTATSANKFPKMPNNDSGFDGGVGGNLYRGSPDFGAGGSGSASHRRYSSTDSMDGSSHYSGHSGGHSGGHSRQGSVSDEISYPTRRVSITTPRRQSTSADPLQFIKSKGAQDLAQIAQVQMKVAAESKKEATITRTKEDDIDWQANLSTWKNRRKSQSERSYQLREELEKMEREKEEGSSGPVLPAKTYSQMQEERERRKSTGRKFYPIEDEEEEEETFHATSVSQEESSIPSYRDQQRHRNLQPEEDDDNRESAVTNQNDDNNNKNSQGRDSAGSRSWRDTRQPASPADEQTPSSLLANRRASRSKLSEKLRSFDEDAEDSGWSSKSATSDQPSRYRRSGSPDYSNSSSSRSMNNGVNSAANDTNGSNGGPAQDSSSEETSESSRAGSFGAKQSSDNSSNSRSYNNSNASDTASNIKLTTRNVGSRTQSKIGSIMRNFEEADSKSAAPKQGYNERINISARKSAFEVTTPREDSTAVLSRPGNATSVRAVPQSAYPEEDTPSEEGSSSGSDEEEDKRSAGHSKAHSVQGNDDQIQAQDFVAKQYSSSNSSVPQMFSSTHSTLQSATETLDVRKNCVEMTIKISQAKNSDRGFGFFLTGGADTDQPLAVSKVALGSSADLCELRLRDQILSVNHQDVTSLTATQVGDIVARAVAVGNIELHIRREKGEDDFEEDEEDFSSSTEGEEDLATPGYSDTQLVSEGQTSVMDQLAAERQWLEKQIEQQNDLEERRRTDDENQTYSQASQEEAELHQSSNSVTLTIPDVGSRNKQHVIDPRTTAITDNQPRAAVSAADSSGWDDGPPAVLRKWQRQRQKEEYTFDSPGGKDVAETFRKISLNTAVPKLQDRDTDLSENEVPPPGTAQGWDQRHDQWTREQDARRQLNTEQNASTAQAEFEESQTKMKTAYEDALKKAEEKERERKKQEQEMLQPELDKVQLLEERKAERRARIFNTAAAATRSPSPPPPPQPPQTQPQEESLFGHRQHLYGNQFEAQSVHSADNVPLAQAAPPANKVQSSSIVFQVEPPNKQHQQPQQLSQRFKMETAHPQQQEGVFVIDPRNRQQHSDYSAKPVAFHVNLATPVRGGSENNSTVLLEAERERIRLEELRKIEDEKRRAEEELRAKEMEEMRKIREKEEELQREKEMLRLERERFLKEQEEFKRFREQQHQPRIVDGSKPKSSNMSFQQAQKAQPNNENNGYQDNKSYAPRSNINANSLPKWPPVNTNYSNNSAVTKASNDNSNNQNKQAGRARGFTREEMLSPSRPTANTDRREWSSPSRDGYHHQQQQHQQQQQQQQQSQPRQQQTHQRLQQQPQSQQPYLYSQQNPNPVNDRGGRSPQSTKKNSQFQGLSDHWLVEEAERRRLAETEGRLHSPSAQPSMAPSTRVGPIQPHAELPNHWRGNHGDRPQQPSGSMPAAIRQTVLLKTANVRGSNGPNDSFDGEFAPPPPPPPHDSYYLSPSSNSPSRSPARSPSRHRSVSPPGSRSPNYSHHSHHHPQSPQQQYYHQQLQQPPQQPLQQQQYRQQIHRHSPQQLQAYPPHHQSPSPYTPPQYNDQPRNSYRDVPQRHAVPPYKAPSPAPPPPHAGGENGMPVSGSQLCSYCDEELAGLKYSKV